MTRPVILFGVEEPRANIQRPAGYGNSKAGQNEIYSRKLVEGHALFPDDCIAAHRFAEGETQRFLRVSAAAASTPLHHSQKILVDQAFLEVFGGGAASLVATFPDYVIARGRDGKVYRISYAAGIDGVTFGQPQEADESKL